MINHYFALTLRYCMRIYQIYTSTCGGNTVNINVIKKLLIGTISY